MLLRFTILILLVLFITPTFAQGNVQGNSVREKISYNNVHHESGICLSVFLEENSEVKNEADKAPIPTAELIDFTFLTTVLTQYHSRFDRDISNWQLTHEPLFKLNCIFLI